MAQAPGSEKILAYGVIQNSIMTVGVDYWAGNTASTLTSRDLPPLKEAGIQMVRIDFAPNYENGWSETVPLFTANGIEVLGLLMRRDLIDNIDAWGDWVYNIVLSYKDYVNVWEIWNEPNLNSFFPGKDPAKYTNFLKTGYTRAKQADPTCIILGGSVVFTKQDSLDFLTAMYQNGAKDYMDALSWHPYCKPYPPDNTQWVNAYPKLETHVRPIMANYGDGDKKIWITEFGYQTYPNGGEDVGEENQADYLVRALEMAQDWGWVEAFIIYNWKDSSTTGKYTKGLVRTDRSTKPSFFAVKDFIASMPP